MYYIEGFKKAIETQCILAKTVQLVNGNKVKFNSRVELKSALNRYLINLQPEIPIRNYTDSIICVDPIVNKKLVKLFNNQSELNDLNQQQIVKEKKDSILTTNMPLLNDSLMLFSKLDQELYQLFLNTVNYIFFADSTVAGGGSSSAAIGCIWINPKPSWTQQDVVELFVHECTHNLLFLDERRFLHYPDYKLINDKNYFGYSSILKKPRPLDKVVHSFVVASEVLSFRQRFFNPKNLTVIHPDTDSLLRNMKKTYLSLLEIPHHYLTSRAWDIIEKSYLVVKE